MENPVPNLPQETVQAPNQTQAGPPPSQPIVVVPSESKIPKPRIFILFLAIIVLLGGSGAAYLLLKPSRESTVVTTPETPGTPSSGEESIPSNMRTIPLNDLAGGSASGSATRDISSAGILHSISATLPDLTEGQFYQVWLYRNPEDYFPIGSLVRDESGTYKIDSSFEFTADNPAPASFEHDTVVVSLETVNDAVIETRILEGTFSL